jgi:hypothetical protein
VSGASKTKERPPASAPESPEKLQSENHAGPVESSFKGLGEKENLRIRTSFISKLSKNEVKWGFDYTYLTQREEVVLPKNKWGKEEEKTYLRSFKNESEITYEDFDPTQRENVARLWQEELAYRDYIASRLFPKDFFEFLIDDSINKKVLSWLEASCEIRGIGPEGNRSLDEAKKLISEQNYLKIISFIDGKNYSCLPPVIDIQSAAEGLARTNVLVLIKTEKIQKAFKKITELGMTPKVESSGINVSFEMPGDPNDFFETVFPFPDVAWNRQPKMMDNKAYLNITHKRKSSEIVTPFLDTPPIYKFLWSRFQSTGWKAAPDLGAIYMEWSPSSGPMLLVLNPYKSHRYDNVEIFAKLKDKWNMNKNEWLAKDSFDQEISDESETGIYYLDSLTKFPNKRFNLNNVKPGESKRWYDSYVPLPLFQKNKKLGIGNDDPDQERLAKNGLVDQSYEERVKLGELSYEDATIKLLEIRTKEMNQYLPFYHENLGDSYLDVSKVIDSEIRPDLISFQEGKKTSIKRSHEESIFKPNSGASEEAKSENGHNKSLEGIKGELSLLEAKIESERIRWQAGIDTINRLTNNKRTAVQEGTQAYYKCLEASKVVQEVEAGAAKLKAEKAKLEVAIKAIEK